MRFGLFFQAPESRGRSHAERYAEMFELIELADSLGFDVAWLAELHFGGAFSLLSNPLMAVPVIAERTRRIRIGTAVTPLPLHHPLSLAEQAATADLLSGGRLEFGVGRGSIPTQFHGFGLPVKENRARFDEALDIIRLAWTRDRFSYPGTFYQVEDLEVVPRPLQQPHPPIRVGVHTPESFAHIGDLGLPIYSGTTTTPLPQLRECLGIYREHLARAGHAWRADQMALMFPVHVGAERRRRARRHARRGAAVLQERARHLLGTARVLRRPPAAPAGHRGDASPICRTSGSAATRRSSAMSPRSSTASQAAREELSLSQIICWFDQGAMLPRAEVERTMRRFAETSCRSSRSAMAVSGDRPREEGYLVLADITGYTSFLTHTELEHAHGIVAEPTALVIAQLAAPLRFVELEGDAVRDAPGAPPSPTPSG